MEKNFYPEANRKVTATDVALKAGVSKWAVSRAFTEGASIAPETLQKVLAAAKECGYRPNLLARGLSKSKTQIVGLVVDQLSNPNILRVLDEVTRQLQMSGYISMILNVSSEQSNQNALALADQFQVDGVIFLGTVLTGEIQKLAHDIKNIPLIVLYRNSDHKNIQVVSTDGFSAGKEIAELFIKESYTKIGYMSGPISESTQLKRLDGFIEGLNEQHIKLSCILAAGEYQRERGYLTMKQYLKETSTEAMIDAIFCENDILAIGALEALREFKQAKIAVVGFDDIDLASSINYQLTTYRQPLEQLVQEAIRRISSYGDKESKYLVPGKLILRKSHKKQTFTDS